MVDDRYVKRLWTAPSSFLLICSPWLLVKPLTHPYDFCWSHGLSGELWEQLVPPNSERSAIPSWIIDPQFEVRGWSTYISCNRTKTQKPGAPWCIMINYHHCFLDHTQYHWSHYIIIIWSALSSLINHILSSYGTSLLLRIILHYWRLTLILLAIPWSPCLEWIHSQHRAIYSVPNLAAGSKSLHFHRSTSCLSGWF